MVGVGADLTRLSSMCTGIDKDRIVGGTQPSGIWKPRAADPLLKLPISATDPGRRSRYSQHSSGSASGPVQSSDLVTTNSSPATFFYSS